MCFQLLVDGQSAGGPSFRPPSLLRIAAISLGIQKHLGDETETAGRSPSSLGALRPPDQLLNHSPLRSLPLQSGPFPQLRSHEIPENPGKSPKIREIVQENLEFLKLSHRFSQENCTE